MSEILNRRRSCAFVGRVAIRRRQALQGMGALVLSRSLFACAQDSSQDVLQRDDLPPSSLVDCVVTPEMVEGPFFSDLKLDRADFVTGEDVNVSSGIPLKLVIHVLQIEGDRCSPMEECQVDIWHADVDGLYSAFASNFFQETDTAGRSFLRGYQRSDARGVVEFNTIYPGWYGTRTLHIHFKLRMQSGYEFTSQIYFDETINDLVMSMAPYNTRGERLVRNMTDEVFNGTGPGKGPNSTPPEHGIAPGMSTLITPEPLSGGARFAATFKVGVQVPST